MQPQIWYILFARIVEGEITSMAAFRKHYNAAVYSLLKHNNREAQNPSNTDIDPARQKLNYNLTPPDRGNTLAENKEYYNNRLNEVYHYKRDTLVTCGEWIVTAPVDLPKEQEGAFFKACYDFFNSKYGEKNVFHCSIHYDEGIKNDQGEIVWGKPHMHYMFIPVVSCPEKKGYIEKVCSKELIDRKHLLTIHPELQRYIEQQGIHCNVNPKNTEGKNRSVRELKKESREYLAAMERIKALEQENTALKKELEILKEKQREVSSAPTRSRFGTRKEINIEREKQWEKEKDIEY